VTADGRYPAAMSWSPRRREQVLTRSEAEARRHRLELAVARGELPAEPPEDLLSERRIMAQVAAWLGLALQAELAYLPFLLSFFIAPIIVTVAIYAGWFLLLRWMVRHRHEHPRLVLALPIAEAVGWVALMSYGIGNLGWAPLRIFPGY
jgi:hypothetical protein